MDGSLSFKQFPANAIIILDALRYPWRLWVGKHIRGHLSSKSHYPHPNSTDKADSKRAWKLPDTALCQNIWLFLTLRAVLGPNLGWHRSPRGAPAHRGATVTHLQRPGSGTARSWGCTPGFRQHTHTGRTLLHFHRRLHHTLH